MDGIFRTELLFFQLGNIKRSVFTQHTMGRTAEAVQEHAGKSRQMKSRVADVVVSNPAPMIRILLSVRKRILERCCSLLFLQTDQRSLLGVLV